MTFQLFAGIGLGLWGGMKVDEMLGLEQPIFTLVLTLIGLAASLYLIIKEVLSD